MKSKVFGIRIPPRCEYCQFGTRAKEGNKVLCEKQGLVTYDYHCAKYEYCPFKRIPKKNFTKGFDDDDTI